ncbi:MAG: class I adenylate-forming enzyme family protein, partial [Halolamina sp.]
MHDWLAHRARATPGQEALVNAESGNAWSYATLDETVEEMAGRLRALGVEADDHLAAVLGTGVEEVCLIHATMRLGTTLVPLSPEFTPPELRERFERADIDHVVCDAGTEATVRDAVETVDPWLPVLTIDDPDWGDATSLSEAEPTTVSPADWDREDVQLLLFTSGTTGTAKTVQLTMGNLLASAAASAFRLGIDPEDRWLVPLSLHHMGGIAPILRSTLYGTTAIVKSSFDPGGTVDDLRKYDATCISLVPTMLRRMLDARGTLPDSLRFVLVGGAPCPEELIDRCRDFSVPVCPTYGMTETASQVATARHRDAYETPSTVGRPLLWTEVTVVDESGSELPPGETGELVVNGPTVTPGYYDDPAATGEAIGPQGLHTGDVGYQDETGRLYVLNRLDDRILTGGENVDPGEVVDALREHPEVTDAAVVGLPDEEWGEQVAALVVADGEALTVAELESFLRERLAGFKIPRTLAFTKELPRTVSGTVDREAVRERLEEGETETIDRRGTSGRAATDTGSADTVAEENEPGALEPADEKPASSEESTEPSDGTAD